jgi:hypothetical protein
MKLEKKIVRKVAFLCVGFLLVLWSASTPETRVQENELSSLSTLKATCNGILARCSKFNAEKFQKYVKKFEANQGPTADEIRSAPKDPELLLAAAEYFSAKTSLGSFGFKDRLSKMKLRERRRLDRALARFSNRETFSQQDFYELCAELYRLSHKPLGVWGALRVSSNLVEAWDKIDDQVIMQRLEILIYNRGLQEAFATLIDPSAGASVRQLIKNNPGWIDTTVFAGIWLASACVQYKYPDIAMPLLVQYGPAYLPSLKQFLAVTITAEDTNILFTQGLEAAFDAVKPRADLLRLRGRFWGVARATYFAVFSALFLHALPQQLAHERFEESFSQISATAEQGNLSPEALARQQFEEYLKIKKESGENADPNAPENQAKLEFFIQIQQSAADFVKQKKTH